MIPFKAPIDEIIFSLEHVAEANRIPGWDSQLVQDIIQHFGHFAEGEIAPLNEQADQQGCRVENGLVYTPTGFKEVYQQFIEQGWNGLSIPESYEGLDLPAPVLGAVSEIFSGACHALQMIVGLVPGAVRLLTHFGTEQQQQEYIALLASGKWLATMCLTEPNAGSDLSGIRTKAKQQDDNWYITGNKIFISGGGQDISPHIMHFVLAKTEGDDGLSLFLCRSHLDDGESNGVMVDRIEEKLGLHGSPTCQLVFDNAKAELIGTPGQGLKIFFTLMNHARLDVGLQGVAHATRAASIAKAYAAERVQGRTPGSGQQVTIDQHHDVASFLTQQQALAIGGRAMCHLALVNLQLGNDDLVEFLTPVCKVFGSEAGIHSADLGIQVLGGYGYLREYGMEQTWRDARITSIYEGTNSIQGITLATRLLNIKQGAAADAFEQLINSMEPDEGLTASFGLWKKMRAEIKNADDPTEKAFAFMKLTGLVTYHAVWLKILSVADQSNDADQLNKLAHYVKHRAPVEAQYWSSI